MVRLDDIARSVGCSKGTVCHILNRNDPRYSSKLREQVLQVAKEKGYTADGTAQALSTGRSMNIGLMGVNWNDLHLFKAISVAGEIATVHSHHLMVAASTSKADWAMMLQKRKADFMISFNMEPDEVNLSVTAAIKDKIVKFAGEQGSSLCRYAVLWDDFHGGELLAQHLVELGHRRLAILSGDHISQRVAGFFHYCLEKGITPWILVGHGANPVLFDRGVALIPEKYRSQIIIADSTQADEQLKIALRKDPTITGVFVRNDQMAACALEMAEEMNISVPGRLSIVGYTDIGEGLKGMPKLTTIHTPIAEGIRLVLEDYFSALNAKREPRKEDIRLEVSLVVGKTTGAPHEKSA